MPKPFFSIITCTYNSEKYLQDCINSVENQSFKDYEHIFIDGYSRDKTMNIIKKYQKHNPDRVKIYQYRPHGISQAMNMGIKHVRGNIICHLHSDDYFYSSQTMRRVKKEVKRHPKASLFVGDCLFKTGTRFRPVFPSNQIERFLHHTLIRSYIFLGNKIPHPSVFIKKAVFKRWKGFNESFKVVMDYEFWFRILRQERVVFIDEFLSVYRVHANTISNLKKQEGKQEIKKLFNRHKGKYFIEQIISVFLRILYSFFRNVKKVSPQEQNKNI